MSQTPFLTTETDDVDVDAPFDDTGVIENPADEPESTDDDIDEGSDETSAEGSSTPGRARASAASNRALIRRVAAKTVEVAGASERTREAAAALLGTSSAPVDLTTAIMVASRGVVQPINDLNKITGADDPFDAMMFATDLGRDRIKAVWVLLDSLGSSPGREVPTAISKAAKALCVHLTSLDESVSADLVGVVDLLRKS